MQIVKLDNFGFGQLQPSSRVSSSSSSSGNSRSSSAPAIDADRWSAGLRADLQAAGLLLAELLFAGLAEGREVQQQWRSSLPRLLFDVFELDMEQFREYCVQVRGGGEGGMEQFREYSVQVRGGGGEGG